MFGRSSGRIDLPSMPATLARIIQITNSPDATSDQVAKVVMLDQSLSTKVLRLANSAYYGRRTKTETITDAVATLGFSSVRNLAASASIIDALFPKRMFPGFSWQDMWIHSVTCAVASDEIYTRMCGRGSESVFVAGLLHDVGKLIIARALPHRFVQVINTCQAEAKEMISAEIELLSTTHAKIGGELAQQWEFPESLYSAISYHHAYEMAGDFEDIARAVHAGNLLAKRLCKSYIVGIQINIGIKDIADVSELRADEINFIVDNTRERLRQCKEILSWGNNMPGASYSCAA